MQPLWLHASLEGWRLPLASSSDMALTRPSPTDLGFTRDRTYTAQVGQGRFAMARPAKEPGERLRVTVRKNRPRQ